jgi:hypothetical protein
MSALAGHGAVIDHLALHDLVASAPGTAYVDSLVAEGRATQVRLVYPHGRVVEVAVPAVPTSTPRPPAGLDRVLAVQVRIGDGAPRCSVLGSGPDGPRRQDIGWSLALGLAAAGTRTVFLTD